MNIQTLLVIGAIILIGGIVVQVNSTLQDTTNKNIEATTILTALNLAEGMMSEIRNHRWDNTIGATPGNFQAPSALAKNAGETYNHNTMTDNFASMNSFNNFNDTVKVDSIQYQIKVKIVYVSNTDLNTTMTSATNNKKITVSVRNVLSQGQYMQSLPSQTLTISYIATYQQLFNQAQIN